MLCVLCQRAELTACCHSAASRCECINVRQSVPGSSACMFNISFQTKTGGRCIGEWIINHSAAVWSIKGRRQPVITVLTGSSCLRFLPGRPTLRLVRGLAGVPSSGPSWSAPSSLWPIIERKHQTPSQSNNCMKL